MDGVDNLQACLLVPVGNKGACFAVATNVGVEIDDWNVALLHLTLGGHDSVSANGNVKLGVLGCIADARTIDIKRTVDRIACLLEAVTDN